MRKRVGFCLFGILCGFVSICLALEQTFSDLPCSVEVLPAFSLSLDRNQIDFGLVEPGSAKTLPEAGHFNELRCRSNYGRIWYLKAELLFGPKLAGGDFSLPLSAFKFKVVSAQALSEPKAKFQFEPLEKKSEIIYISQGEENIGKEVALRFQYQFESPVDAPAGTYTGQVLFTLTDTP